MKKYKPGYHPNSRKNLELGGRKPDFEVKKDKKTISLTKMAWDGLILLSEESGYSSVSAYLENLGREKQLKQEC